MREVKKRGSVRILVSVRDFPKIDPNFFGELSRALDALAEKKQVRISFAEFGRGDAEIWKKIYGKSQNSVGWKIAELPESAEGILREVRKFDLVIGMRLHSLIAAKLAGVPAIGLSYSRKVGEFAEKSLSLEDFRAEKLLKILN
jgi:polysaccharide pyruvyl transferase WcaK-like protein